MRIIQIINALTFGGAQVILLDLVKRLRKDGHQIEVIAFRDGPIGKKLRDLGCQTHILAEKLLDIPAFFEIKKIISSFKPHLVHSHLFKATFWARLACRSNPNIRLVTSIHGSESLLFHHLEKLTSHLSDHLIFPSRYLRNWYAKTIRPLKKINTSIIYPGVDIQAPPDLCQSKKLTIGTLSRLHPVKGIDRLLRAAGILKKRGINFEVLIGGEGKHRNELFELARKLEIEDICQFSGEIQDQKNFLSKLDIFVAASRQEAFGIHVCEAMEREIPVVAANIGGLPEIVADNSTGFLFEAENIESLADKLQHFLTNNEFRRKAGKLSRQRIQKFFNRNIAIEKHLDIYQKLSQQEKSVHFAISSGELGGGERLALGLMKSLKSRGWSVSATCCGEPLAEELRLTGIPHSISSIKAGGLFFAAKLLTNLAKKRPKVVSSHLNKASLFSGMLGKLMGIPVVSHVHGLNRLSYYKFSDHLIAVSMAVEENLLQQNAMPSRLSTIKNCIAGKCEQSPKAIASPIKIAIVAKLHHNKGHMWALKAILSNKQSLPPFELHIIGDGPERQSLEQLCASMHAEKFVIFHGFVAQPELIMKDIHVALLPSLGEGIPLSLLEAMSQGIPCIASKVGGIPEVITNGLNGILIESNDQQGLLNAISAICNPETFRKLSAGAIAEFKRLNNYNEMIDQTENLFLGLVEKQL